MVASRPTPPAAQQPPELPSMPTAPPALPDYLRRFSLWCRNNFANTVTTVSSIPFVHMLSPGNLTFKISVADSGLLISTPIIPGTGDDGTPVIAFAPAVTPNSSSGSRNGSVGVTSTSYHMLGLKLTLNLQYEKQAVAIATGGITNSVAGGETDVVICFGTGVAPLPGDALTGTIIGSGVQFIAPTAGATGTFTISGVAPTAGAAYWFDLAGKMVGGNGAVIDANMTASGLA